jgi:oligopeptide transport system substrate-binding protein
VYSRRTMAAWAPRGLSLAMAALVALTLACAPGQSGAGSAELASDQRLRIAMVGDVETLDPALLSEPHAASIAQNVFAGLYRLDDNLNEVPDIAEGMPQISPDGVVYTFRLRSDVRFSNGDPLVARDVVYSWNRAAALQGPYADTLKPIAGYQDVARGAAATMTGLSAADDRTVVARLTAPAGWFLTAVSMWWAEVVDRQVIEARGQNDWWKTPGGLVGAGPFHMTDRNPGRWMDFAAVRRFWRGATGLVSEVRVGIEPDSKAAVSAYAAGAYDAFWGGAPPEDAANARTAGVEKDLRRLPAGRTEFVGFNVQAGPFEGLARGLMGRLAFSLAIDRRALAEAVCRQSQDCHPATGGLISQGLRGHLGDDPNAHFDPARARALYRQWDPDGSRVKGLAYHFESFEPIRLAAENLRAQWKTNLGVDVQLAPADPATYQPAKNRGAYEMFREGWAADYNHPQNWYQLFRSDLPFDHFGYVNQRFDALVQQADGESLARALGHYSEAGRLLIADVAYAGLLYSDRMNLARPYVQGVGGNAITDYPWTEARLLRRA